VKNIIKLVVIAVIVALYSVETVSVYSNSLCVNSIFKTQEDSERHIFDTSFSTSLFSFTSPSEKTELSFNRTFPSIFNTFIKSFWAINKISEQLFINEFIQLTYKSKNHL